MRRWAFAWIAAAELVVAGCGDPLRDELIEALGDEDPNFPASAIHRPGQPCVACHSSYKSAEPELSIGGTLFSEPKGSEPPFMVAGYTVRLIDSEGEMRDIVSNACGNFQIEKKDWNPAFPLRAELYGPSEDDPTKLLQVGVMSSRIGRDGSCAGCHVHPKSIYSPGVVFVPGDPAKLTAPAPGTCPPPWLGPDPRLPELQ